jgi:hypothetical protein
MIEQIEFGCQASGPEETEIPACLVLVVADKYLVPRGLNPACSFFNITLLS